MTVYPTHGTCTEPSSHEGRENIAVLRTSQEIPLVFTGNALRSRATKRAIDQPTGIAFDRHKRGDYRGGIQKAHSAVNLIATTKHVLLNPGVSRFLEPVSLFCARIPVCHRMDAFVNHRVHLGNAVAIRAAGIKAIKRIKRSGNSGVARYPGLPSSSGVRDCATSACARTVIVNGTVFAVLSLGVGSPA